MCWNGRPDRANTVLLLYEVCKTGHKMVLGAYIEPQYQV